MDELNVSVVQKPGEIACNFDEIEEALKNQMQAYRDLEVTEDNIPERKADVATLRKIKAAIDDKRKEVQKTYDEPLEAFKARVKKLTGHIDDEINRINAGLDEFEQKRIKAKWVHVRELYDKEVGNLSEFLPFDVIKSSKWGNKTCTDQDIVFALQEMTLKVRNDIDAIKALGSDIEDKLLVTYRASGNKLAAAIQKNTEYQEAKKVAEAKVRAEAAEAPAPERVAITPEQIKDAVDVPKQRTWTIRVTGDEDIEALRTFLDLSGIKFEEV